MMLFEQKKDLETISIDYLYEGLTVKDDIYNHSGKLLLVAKGITLNGVMLKRLRKFNDSNRNIKVSAKIRDELMSVAPSPEQKRREFENETGYSKIKHHAMSIITISGISDQVPYEQLSDAGNLITERIETTNPAVILQWINAHKESDEYLYRHSANVAILNGLMAKWLGLGEKETEELIFTGLVHDIGKTRIPVSILKSPEPLSGPDLETMRRHPAYSAEMLDCEKFGEEIRLAARHHHEKMNGTGYPDGLSGDAIPFYAKVTAVSNSYDEMASERSYKNAQSPFKIIMRMRTEHFQELDMKLARLFGENLPRELTGKPALMSDGRSGIVKYIDDKNIEYPIVEIEGEIIRTNPGLYCLSMLIED
ncbi:MAG: HD-GYP domain-containing protein [Oscillospiraceae bacterium]|nr:HD-GYP domain-containing protein [Oscillospiraceae bacterium]